MKYENQIPAEPLPENVRRHLGGDEWVVNTSKILASMVSAIEGGEPLTIDGWTVRKATSGEAKIFALIFSHFFWRLGDRALELNDPVLLKLMHRLGVLRIVPEVNGETVTEMQTTETATGN